MWCISLGKKAFLRKGCRGRKARAPPPPTPHHQSGRSPSPRSRENSSGLYSSAFLIRTTPLNPPGEQREEEPVVNLKKAGPGSGNWRAAGTTGRCGLQNYYILIQMLASSDSQCYPASKACYSPKNNSTYLGGQRWQIYVTHLIHSLAPTNCSANAHYC